MKLTKVQVIVLRRLAAGEVIASRRWRTAGTIRTGGWLYVSAPTMKALRARGFIEVVGSRLQVWAAHPEEWAITDMGRKALEGHDAANQSSD